MIFEETAEDSFINAIVSGTLSDVQAFLANAGDVNAIYGPWSALHYAIEHGQLEVLKYLLQIGADPDCMCSGWRPFHHAIDIEADTAAQGNEPISLESVPLLIEGGADVNQPDENGQTPLRMAIERGHEDAVNLLREHGAVD